MGAPRGIRSEGQRMIERGLRSSRDRGHEGRRVCAVSRGWTTLLRPFPPVTSRAPCAGERGDGRARAAKRARGPK